MKTFIVLLLVLVIGGGMFLATVPETPAAQPAPSGYTYTYLVWAYSSKSGTNWGEHQFSCRATSDVEALGKLSCHMAAWDLFKTDYTFKYSRLISKVENK